MLKRQKTSIMQRAEDEIRRHAQRQMKKDLATANVAFGRTIVPTMPRQIKKDNANNSGDLMLNRSSSEEAANNNEESLYYRDLLQNRPRSAERAINNDDDANRADNLQTFSQVTLGQKCYGRPPTPGRTATLVRPPTPGRGKEMEVAADKTYLQKYLESQSTEPDDESNDMQLRSVSNVVLPSATTSGRSPRRTTKSSFMVRPNTPRPLGKKQADKPDEANKDDNLGHPATQENASSPNLLERPKSADAKDEAKEPAERQNRESVSQITLPFRRPVTPRAKRDSSMSNSTSRYMVVNRPTANVPKKEDVKFPTTPKKDEQSRASSQLFGSQRNLLTLTRKKSGSVSTTNLLQRSTSNATETKTDDNNESQETNERDYLRSSTQSSLLPKRNLSLARNREDHGVGQTRPSTAPQASAVNAQQARSRSTISSRPKTPRQTRTSLLRTSSNTNVAQKQAKTATPSEPTKGYLKATSQIDCQRKPKRPSSGGNKEGSVSARSDTQASKQMKASGKKVKTSPRKPKPTGHKEEKEATANEKTFMDAEKTPKDSPRKQEEPNNLPTSTMVVHSPLPSPLSLPSTSTAPALNIISTATYEQKEEINVEDSTTPEQMDPPPSTSSLVQKEEKDPKPSTPSIKETNSTVSVTEEGEEEPQIELRVLNQKPKKRTLNETVQKNKTPQNDFEDKFKDHLVENQTDQIEKSDEIENVNDEGLPIPEPPVALKRQDSYIVLAEGKLKDDEIFELVFPSNESETEELFEIPDIYQPEVVEDKIKSDVPQPEEDVDKYPLQLKEEYEEQEQLKNNEEADPLETAKSGKDQQQEDTEEEFYQVQISTAAEDEGQQVEEKESLYQVQILDGACDDSQPDIGPYCLPVLKDTSEDITQQQEQDNEKEKELPREKKKEGLLFSVADVEIIFINQASAVQTEIDAVTLQMRSVAIKSGLKSAANVSGLTKLVHSTNSLIDILANNRKH